MSFEWIAKVEKFKTGAPSKKAVILALASFADEEGRCHPSIKKIGEITEQSESTIKRALCDLVQGGFIKKLRRRRRKNGNLSVYEYQILTRGQCDQRSNQLQSKMTPELEVKMPPQEPVIPEPIIIPHQEANNQRKEFQDEFEEFWLSVWVPFDMGKGSKQVALKKFIDHRNKGVSYEKIERGGKEYIDFCHRTKCRTKHVSTWISQCGWEDEHPSSIRGFSGNKYSGSKECNPRDALALALADQTRQ